ncbi:hypothetical protein NCC49_004231 [Naganishia albida]|nr:hypothetical protein NCC49_004231 [Naganishia albida]
MPMDTTEYLTAQGWKGKGTALKQGHMTRPIAVVQKKTLSGVGKDRDEAVPFWDNIFAAAAINIRVSSQTPTPAASGTATPTKGGSPAPSRSSQTQSSMTAFARGKQEMARRILYSKFLRGQVILSEDLDKIPGASEQPAKAVNAEAGSSFSIAALRDSRSPSVRLAEGTVSSDTSALVDGKKKESKEEKAQRRAEKAAKKQRSLEKKASKQAKLDRREKRKTQLAEGEDSPLLDGTIKKQKSRKSEGKERARNGDVIGQGEEDVDETDKKKRKRESRATSVEDGTSVADNDAAVKPKKKKKRKADGEV